MKARKIFTKLQKELENNKILLLIGPRQVGKTTLLKQLKEEIRNKKTFFINLEHPYPKQQLNQDPNNIFKITLSSSKEKQVIFLDEIQYLDDPSSFLKYMYDEYKENIKLIVSGSSSFYIDKKFKDSLMGRKKMFEIFTCDFEEFLDFKDEIEIKEILFEKKQFPDFYKSKIEQLFLEYITYGGYPEVILTDDINEKKELLGNLSLDYIKKDIFDANIAMTDKFLNLLKILATQTGELVNILELARTLKTDTKTIEKYLYVMRKSYSIALIKPFWSNLRAELTKMPKIFFFDVGLRNAILKNFENINDRFDKGQFFENIVWKEFIFKYKIDDIKYWRTKDNNEIDFIIEDNNAFEVKFSEDLIRESKYKLFKEKYANIPLEFITFENLIEKIIIFMHN